MIAAISPFWDGNETWLVVVGASLFATFPVVYAVFLPAFYFPVLLMLLRADLSRRRLRVPQSWRSRRIVGLGIFPRLHRRRLRPGRRGRGDDPRHSGGEQPICRRPFRMAHATAGIDRDRARARLCAARRRLASDEKRGGVARLGASAHSLARDRGACLAHRGVRRGGHGASSESAPISASASGVSCSPLSACWRWPACSSACASVATVCRSR